MHYCEAWKSSPRVAALSLEAYKGFFEILNSIWLAECLLPDDEQTLIGASRLTLKQWKKAEQELFGGRKPLLRKEGGYVVNDRLLREWERTQGLRQERRENGRRGAEKRWQNDSKAIAKPSHSHQFANSKTMQTETETETETTEEFPNGHSSGGGQFFADESYREFADAYRPLKDYGLNGPAPMQAYSEQVASPNGQEIHQRIMAGVKRMAGSGKARQYFPTAENFLKNQHYLDAWAPESNRPKSALGRLKDKLEAANAN